MIETFLTSHFGKDIHGRVQKLIEEVSELRDAQDDADFAEELADVALVLYHIARLRGLTFEDLIQRAYDKVRLREMNGREKPHEERGCGNCIHFTNEEIGGCGICLKHNEPRHCSYLCTDYSKE